MDAFSVYGRYGNVRREVDRFMSEGEYYKQAVLLELYYLREIHGMKMNYQGKIDFSDETHGFGSDTYNIITKIIEDIKSNVIWWGENKRIIKDLEAKYNHDIVAVQYYVMLQLHHYPRVNEDLVHFGLTSQDIVNSVYTKIFHTAINDLMLHKLKVMIRTHMEIFFCEKKDLYMSAFTHGQKAVPITAKTLFKGYSDRMDSVINRLEYRSPVFKFGNGAVGNNIHLDLLGIDRAVYGELISDTLRSFMVNIPFDLQGEGTTQNNNYPYINDSIYDIHKLLNILKDLSVDMWQYASMGYINKRFSATEHGSSTMPQKSNPIEFENAEGNIELAIGLCQTYMNKLNLSRLQRDLSDLTMMRNLDTLMCYIIQAIESLSKGFSRFTWNDELIRTEMKQDFSLFLESIQLFEKLKGEDGMTYEEVKSSIRTHDEFMAYINNNKGLGLDFVTKIKKIMGHDKQES